MKWIYKGIKISNSSHAKPQGSKYVLKPKIIILRGMCIRIKEKQISNKNHLLHILTIRIILNIKVS